MVSAKGKARASVRIRAYVGFRVTATVRGSQASWYGQGGAFGTQDRWPWATRTCRSPHDIPELDPDAAQHNRSFFTCCGADRQAHATTSCSCFATTCARRAVRSAVVTGSLPATCGLVAAKQRLCGMTAAVAVAAVAVTAAMALAAAQCDSCAKAVPWQRGGVVVQRGCNAVNARSGGAWHPQQVDNLGGSRLTRSAARADPRG